VAATIAARRARQHRPWSFGTALPQVFISGVFLSSSHAPRGLPGRGRRSLLCGRAPRRDRPGVLAATACNRTRIRHRGRRKPRLPAEPAPGPKPLPFQCVRADRRA
jgi:hypothetical protein